MMPSRRPIRLTRSQVGYLTEATFLPVSNEQLLEDLRFEDGDSAVILVADDVVEDVRSALTNEVARIGFDSNYDLTTEGRLLEELIDCFAVGDDG
jgi:hypothetical protein